MKSYQEKFIAVVIESGALQWGDFCLKSGRISPYFFNMGNINTGHHLNIIAKCYTDLILENNIVFSTLFGPAYKGISLAALIASKLSEQGMIVNFSFNRKEEKTQGEGGSIVGPIEGPVLIVDDVITAGSAVKHSLSILSDCGAQVMGVLVGLDRLEKGDSDKSACEEISDLGLAMYSVITLEYIEDYLLSHDPIQAGIIKQYRSKYGI